MYVDDPVRVRAFAALLSCALVSVSNIALAANDPVIGNIDGVVTGVDGTFTLNGWACNLGSLPIHSGGPVSERTSRQWHRDQSFLRQQSQRGGSRAGLPVDRDALPLHHLADQPHRSVPGGHLFAQQRGSGYACGSSIIKVNGERHAFFCSRGSNTGTSNSNGWDAIRYTHSTDGFTWATPVLKLTASACPSQTVSTLTSDKV
jgi:hypothetical protein